MFKFKNYDLKRFNVLLILVVLTLGFIGSYLIKQVQSEQENLLKKQIVGLVAGLAIACFVAIVDYHFISKFFIVLYIINLLLLVAVKVAGVSVNNAKRWLDIKGFKFQPSELSKIILIIFFAKLFIIFQDKINNIFILLLSLAAMGVPTYLILTQTDLSTSMVLIFIFVIILFAADLKWKVILPILLVGIPLIIGLFWYIRQDYQVLLSPYQQERILSILEPEEHPETMWQQENSIQAIGSGQLLGKRFTDESSDIRGYDYVPISESDFIFSVLGEEFGFLGSCLVIGLFMVIIFSCINTARMAPDKLGMLISVGIASMFMFQVFVNIGVATAFLPNTGIPLPFVSYGLSSLLSSMIAIGIILNIRLQPKKNRG